MESAFIFAPLPPYSPAFNAIEPVWHHVRLQASHNRYHASLPDLVSVLDATLAAIAAAPKQVQGHLNPFL
jgi:transposase